MTAVEPGGRTTRPNHMRFARLWTRARLARLALPAVAVTLAAACSHAAEDGHGESSCAAIILHQGHTYFGYGELKRDPATTGRQVTATIPSCDDSGGQESVEPSKTIHVAELVNVPLETAFRWDDSIFIREGRKLPDVTRTWFRAPGCATAGTFELVGGWLGVTGPKKPRFEGDLRAPYRLQVHVTEGPNAYVGTTIAVHADATTDVTLSPNDVKRSLWRSGDVAVVVTCDAGRFQALSLRVPQA